MFKAIAKDPSDYSSDLHVLLLAENRSGKALIIKYAYDSLSVNSFMSDYSHYSKEPRDGESSVIESKQWESSLSYNQTTSVSDIQEIKFGVEIKDGYTTIDEPILTLV